MLNETICTNCFTKHLDVLWQWQDDHEILWQKHDDRKQAKEDGDTFKRDSIADFGTLWHAGISKCPHFYQNISIYSCPPSECPYILEQTLACQPEQK